MKPKTSPTSSKLLAWIQDTSNRNSWLKFPKLEVYVRRGQHKINGEIQLCFDLASVYATPTGKGTFTRFFSEYESACKEAGVVAYIENVQTPRFQQFFERNGYIKMPPYNST